MKPGSRLIKIFESKVSFLSSALPSTKLFSRKEEWKELIRHIGGNTTVKSESDPSCGPSTTANGRPSVVAAPIQLYIQFLNNFVFNYELTNSISHRVSVESWPIYHSNDLVALLIPLFFDVTKFNHKIISFDTEKLSLFLRD